MKPATLILGASLVVVTGTMSAIILKQHAEIEALRARTAAAPVDRTAALFAPAAAPAVDIAREQEIGPAAPASPRGALAVVTPDGEIAQQRPGSRNRVANRFAEILADPEIATMMKNQQKADLDGRYAALFRRLGLSGPEVEALKELLAEKQLARMETRAVARAEGFGGNDRDAIRELVIESDDEIEARISAILGTDRYAALRKFEATSAERARVAQLDQRLSYSQTPLQDYQSDALVDILRSAPEPRQGGRMGSPEQVAAYLGELEAYDAEMLSRARSVLSPAQLDALRRMQQERQDRVRLNALMRRGGS